jgi:DNA-binding MltR family transcriptional regulator
MEKLENEAEETAFYNHDSDRAVAVVWPAIVENRLTDLLRAGFIPAPKEFEDLFGPGKTIGDLGLKIKMAYIFGLLHKDTVDDLRTLAKIRNAFAHRVDITSFENPPISSWLNSMHSVTVHRSLLKTLLLDPDGNMTKIVVLRGELCDYRNTFHCCIRHLIHHLVDLERKQKVINEDLIKAGEWSPDRG